MAESNVPLYELAIGPVPVAKGPFPRVVDKQQSFLLCFNFFFFHGTF